MSSPPQQQPTSVRVRAVVLAVASMVLGAVFLVLLLTRTPTGDVSVEFSSGLESAGRVDRLVENIHEDGPIPFADTSGSGRDAYVQHLGDDRLTGWHVFQVRRAAASRRCPVDWVPERRVFVDRCNGQEFPEDGEGLPRFDWHIDDKDDQDPDNDELIIDLRSPETRSRADASTTSSTTSTIQITGDDTGT